MIRRLRKGKLIAIRGFLIPWSGTPMFREFSKRRNDIGFLISGIPEMRENEGRGKEWRHLETLSSPRLHKKCRLKERSLRDGGGL